MMKLPFIEAIESKIIGRAPKQMDSFTHVEWDELPPHHSMAEHNLVEYRSSAEVYFKQIAPKDQAKLVQQHAVRAMARHVYEPIENELHLVLQDIWKAGIFHSDAEKRIEKIIAAIRNEAPSE